MADNRDSHGNSAARAMAIVEFLASRPGQTFSLSEIARRCDIRKSTAYTILGTLHANGWLTRSPADRRYGLGPTLVLIGRAAGRVRPEVNLARPVLDKLAGEFQCECLFSMAMGDTIMVLDSTGPSGIRSVFSLPDAQTPLVAPFGAVFVAWRDRAARRDWYSRSGIHDPGQAEQMDGILDETVRRGYLVTVKSDFQGRVAEMMGVMSRDLPAQEMLDEMRERLAAISPIAYLGGGAGSDRQTWQVDSLQAPVFDGDGVPRYAVVVARIGREYDPGSLHRAGRTVRDAADEVTDAISAHGRRLEGA